MKILCIIDFTVSTSAFFLLYSQLRAGVLVLQICKVHFSWHLSQLKLSLTTVAALSYRLRELAFPTYVLSTLHRK